MPVTMRCYTILYLLCLYYAKLYYAILYYTIAKLECHASITVKLFSAAGRPPRDHKVPKTEFSLVNPRP